MNNDKKLKDREYYNIVCDILENEEFCKTKDIVHHGCSRYGHCVRVSYHAYKVAKLTKLDYVSAARAGLLHDFFLEDNNSLKINKKLKTLVNHPRVAAQMSKRYFDITDKEQNIIESHMFPIALSLPRYLESWIVDAVDNVVAVKEAWMTTSVSLKAATNFLAFIVLNYFTR